MSSAYPIPSQHKAYKPQSVFLFLYMIYPDGKIFTDVCHPHVPSAAVHQPSCPWYVYYIEVNLTIPYESCDR